MSLVSLYENKVKSKRQELERFRRKQADEEKVAAKEAAAADKAEDAGRRTSSASTARSKQQEAGRHRDRSHRARDAAAKASAAVAKAQKELHDAEAKLEAERANEAKKRRAKEDSQRRDAERKAARERQREEEQRQRAERQRDAEIAALHARISQQDQRLRASAPERVKVLVVAASPDGEVMLRLDREFREMQRRMRESEHRDSVEFEWRPAARVSDLVQMLNEVRPDVVHFSGHSDSHGLALENADGTTKLLRSDQLAQLLSTMSDNIRLVIFNSCESSSHAEAACAYLEAAIGMEASILDDAAKVFAGQFYNSLGFGRSLREAFDQARLQVSLEIGAESGSPRLYTATDVDAEDIFLVAS